MTQIEVATMERNRIFRQQLRHQALTPPLELGDWRTVLYLMASFIGFYLEATLELFTHHACYCSHFILNQPLPDKQQFDRCFLLSHFTLLGANGRRGTSLRNTASSDAARQATQYPVSSWLHITPARFHYSKHGAWLSRMVGTFPNAWRFPDYFCWAKCLAQQKPSGKQADGLDRIA